MLTVSLVNYTGKDSGVADTICYSNKDRFTYFQNDDVLVYMMDTRIFDRIRAENPAYLESLDGFTYCRNASSSYRKTDSSFVSMLIGAICLNAEPFFTYADSAFKESKFFPTLIDSGMTVSIYCGLATSLPTIPISRSIAWLPPRVR